MAAKPASGASPSWRASRQIPAPTGRLPYLWSGLSHPETTLPKMRGIGNALRGGAAACLPGGREHPRGFRTAAKPVPAGEARSEEHTSELQSLMRISYAVFCLKKKKNNIIAKQ